MRLDTTDREFDKEICRIKTKDDTVDLLVEVLQFDYPSDQKLQPTKLGWDYLNRVLLLLESDADQMPGKLTWRPISMPAAACLATYVILMVHLGFDSLSFVILMIPSAVVAALLVLVNRVASRRMRANAEALDPFPSVASMLRLRRRLPLFARVSYPAHVATTRRKNWVDGLAGAAGYCTLTLVWFLVFSPIVMLLLALPDRSCDIVLPSETPPALAAPSRGART